MEPQRIGLALVVCGLAIALIGGAVALGLFQWFGRLPGDLRFTSGGVRLYLPLTSMLVVSLGSSLVAWLLRRVV